MVSKVFLADLLSRCVLCFAVLAMGKCHAFSQEKPVDLSGNLGGYEMVWHDEFDGRKLDLSKWGYRSLGERGDMVNTMDAVELDGKGHLLIRAYSKGNVQYSGMIHTEGIFSQLYGYFECRAKLHRTPGLWSAFWLQSSSNTGGGTPEKNGAEIDVFEYFPHSRTDAVSHSLHYGGYGSSHAVLGPFYTVLSSTSDGFHTFGLEWTPTEYVIYVDGRESQRGNTLVSKVPEFIILSMEGSKEVAGPLDAGLLPDSFTVDFVRVYARRR